MDIPILPLLFVIVATLAFEGLVYGEEIAADTFSEFDEPEDRDCSGFLDGVACVFTFIVDLFQAIFAAVIFLFRLIIFDVPDAPWWIRLPVATVLGGGIVLIVVQVFRGN